jgi:hypothetical protein
LNATGGQPDWKPWGRGPRLCSGAAAGCDDAVAGM